MYVSGVANLRLASHMRLFEGLFVALDKCTRVPFTFLCYYIFKNYRCVCVFKMSFKLLTTNKYNVITKFIYVQVKNDIWLAVTNYSPNLKELLGEL